MTEQTSTRESDAEYLAAVLRHVPDSVYVIRESGTILFANRAPRGADVHAIVGTPITRIIAEEHRGRFRRCVEAAFRSKLPVNFELQARPDGESTGWFSGRLTPVVERGEPVSAVVLMADITERRARERRASKADEDGTFGLARDRALENIVTVCAATKKVRFRGQWVPVEEFLWERYGVTVSHGLCDEALDRISQRCPAGSGRPGE